MRTSIQNIHDRIACIFPKTHGQIQFMDHCLGCLYDGSTNPFLNPILFWIIRHYHLPLDSCSSTKCFKILGGVLPFFTKHQHFDIFTCLILHKGFKLLKLTKYFILGIHKVNPGLSRGIINK
jgi:hypothetical protein